MRLSRCNISVRRKKHDIMMEKREDEKEKQEALRENMRL